MLKDHNTLKKGEIYTIDGESDTKKSWRVLESEYVRINVSKSKMNTTFSFVTNAAPDEIERLTSEIRKQDESTHNTVKPKIQMLEDHKTLKKGEIYTIDGESDSKKSWKILNSET